MIPHFFKATASGCFIVIGCCALLASGNIYIGAALFTIALISICNLGIPLFTGAVGYAKTPKDFGLLGIALLGNITGCAVLGALASIALPDLSEMASALVLRRVYPLHIAFISSFICGILMYTAVYTFRTKNSYTGILTCVPVFIIAGFEHSIAYMGFMGLGRTITLTVAVNALTFVIGNGVGAVMLSLIIQGSLKKKDV